MSKEKVVVQQDVETVEVKQQQINYNLVDETINENATLKKELVIVFEEDNPRINIIPDNISYDLSDKISIGGSGVINGLTNEDETLVITTKGTTTNINTNVIQRYNTHYEFPNRGKENVLYIDLETSEVFYWINGEYIKLNDYYDIKIINGGEA